ncbi:hypothetical protein F4781DRAFT_368892 [Annulohypoxylon bovei var. microspora]|nr:hypothetical protein F4781DRAFT_368892 [Annulohypoxylon bovei var. microspora]
MLLISSYTATPRGSRISPRLLVMLINAEAKVTCVRVVDGNLRSITDLAFELGVGDLWEAALKEYGYDPSEVKREDERRRTVYRRLHSAARSGVDTEPMKEGLSSRGLRYRSAAGTTSGEMLPIHSTTGKESLSVNN